MTSTTTPTPAIQIAARAIASEIIAQGDVSGFLNDWRIDRSFRDMVREFVRTTPVTV